jgi:tRNA dimethylallyltransferase
MLCLVNAARAVPFTVAGSLAPVVVGTEVSVAGQNVFVVLYGPTSSGKTKMSVELAQRIRRTLARETVIISADSRQVYRYLDIGTSKTTSEEMQGVPHELISVADPVRKFELDDYVPLARQHIQDAFAKGKVPFVVGGTGIYVKALLEGWDVARSSTVRDTLRRDFPKAMMGDAYAMLRRLDRTTAARVHPNNYEAIINALASAMAPDERRRDDANVRTVVLGLSPAQRVLDQRVERTYDAQVSRGLFEEVQNLNARYHLDREVREVHKRGRESQNQVLHTHGYREYFEVAAERGKPVGKLTAAELAEVRARVVEHIRGYTRRQAAFLRKLPAPQLVTSPERAMAAVAAR